MKKFSMTVLLVAVMFVALSIASVILVAVTATPVEAGGCKCPLVYAPVLCSNGKTYPNLCVAQCHHSSGCVPLPI